jgi:ectoine hydroxylase-related dioxygenase (phytanoyl-CoA dioxygenase family)
VREQTFRTSGQEILLERDLPPGPRGGIPPEEVGDAIYLIGDPPAFDPRLAGLMIEPAVLEPIRGILGTDDIRCHFSNITMKAPRVGRSLKYHRDFPWEPGYIYPRTAATVRAMICLDGMDEENGATGFVAGSHLIAAEDLNSKVPPEQPRDGITLALCPAGSVVFIDPKVLHGGGRNLSARHRRNIIVQWGAFDGPVCVNAPRAESLTGLSEAQIRAWLGARAN